jgi:NAD(P)-dependent dehydrogenase (short-subunit alcohol dehydrogenase family)
MAVVAITGANSGIGLRAARALTLRRHRVIALCRSVDRARAALGDHAEIEEIQMDDLDSVRSAAARIAADGVDVLINNAATFDLGMTSRELTAQGHERVWATNHLGPVALTAGLAASLAQAPRGRVVFIASKGLIAMPRIAIRWDDVDAEHWYTPTKAYYQAKLAQVMCALTLAERAAGAFDVSCLRVPAVRLDADKLAAQPRLQRWAYAAKSAAAADPGDIAETYVALAERGAASGSVYVDEHLASCTPPRFARDPANRARLWQLTQESIGLSDWS